MKMRILMAGCFLFQLFLVNSYGFTNVAYVETNDNAVQDAACFVDTKTNKPFFDTAVIFAANINGTDPAVPEIYLNKQDDLLLNHTNQVSYLHKKGLKVVVALLGNHQAAGWSTISTYKQAMVFAKKIAAFVNQYHLDGIAIDDEYTPITNNQAVLMITRALKSLSSYQGKTIQLVLLGEQTHPKFEAQFEHTTLANFLDSATPGYYPASTYMLPTYVNYGMSKNSLYASVSTDLNTQAEASSLAQTAIGEGWGGFMIFDVNKDSLPYLNAVYNAEYAGHTLKVSPDCLKE